jgi:hypothetical protein
VKIKLKFDVFSLWDHKLGMKAHVMSFDIEIKDELERRFHLKKYDKKRFLPFPFTYIVNFRASSFALLYSVIIS